MQNQPPIEQVPHLPETLASDGQLSIPGQRETQQLPGILPGNHALADRGERLALGLLFADHSPADLAAQLDLKPQEVVALIATLDLDRLVDRWRALNEGRATMLLSQLRSAAAVRLAQFLTADDSETVRKACVDLLKAGVARPAGRAPRGDESAWPTPAPPEFESSMLAALGDLGRSESAQAPPGLSAP